MDFWLQAGMAHDSTSSFDKLFAFRVVRIGDNMLWLRIKNKHVAAVLVVLHVLNRNVRLFNNSVKWQFGQSLKRIELIVACRPDILSAAFMPLLLRSIQETVGIAEA